MYFFSHIPKTAGTALGFIFEYMFDRRTFWDYSETYCMPRGLGDHLRFLSKSGYLSLVGGHVTASSYRELFDSEEIVLLYTIRDPVSHFISKLNHDLNDSIDKLPPDEREHIERIAYHEEGIAKSLLSLSDVEKVFSIDSLFDDSTMHNYIKAFIEIDGIIPGERSYPFFADEMDLSLQYFIWEERRCGANLSRKDPALLLSSSLGLQWHMPILNSSANRKYMIALSNADSHEIRRFLEESIAYYNSLRREYSRRLDGARGNGFQHKKLATCEFKLSQSIS